MKSNNKIGLLGKSLSHSIMPTIIKENTNLEYQFFETQDVDDFLCKKDFKYINVTFPYKNTVINKLNFVSKNVRETNACNLIINRNGKLYGYNTDVTGFNYLIVSNNIQIKNKIILILGNGATSRTISYCLKQSGAKEIIFAVRTKRDDGDIYISEIPYSKINVLINATPVGLQEKEDPLVDLSLFSNLEVVIDLLYNPFKTKLLIEAKTKGIKAVNGLSMLMEQAKQSYYIAFSKKETISEKWTVPTSWRNLVLIGMSLSGKTLLLHKIKDLLNVPGVDTDEEIKTKCQKSIKQIFEEEGEVGFRKYEREEVRNLETKRGIIISTGGGTILDEANYRSLAKNGFIVYIKKTRFDTFIEDYNRPLVHSIDDLNKLYLNRRHLYEKFADIIVSGDQNLDDASKEILYAYLNY